MTLADGTQIAYRAIGRGAPVLFLTRLRANLDDWDPALVDAVADQHRQVILMDYRGVGASTGTPRETIIGMADDAADTLAALKIRKADVMGWSMGGMAAQELALRHPDGIDDLVLAGTTESGGSGFQPGTPLSVQLAGKPSLSNEHTYSDDDYAYLFSGTSDPSRAATIASLRRIEQRKDRDPAVTTTQLNAEVNAIFGWYGANRASALPRLHAKTLVAGGADDVLTPVENSRILAHLIPGAKLIIYPEGGHGFLQQGYQSFAWTLTDFIKG